jgi:hypothetical protein
MNIFEVIGIITVSTIIGVVVSLLYLLVKDRVSKQ